MGRTLQKLVARRVETARKPGLLNDGGGLYLQVSPSGSKSWLFRFMLRGKAREMGLGSVRDIALTKARERAAECRKLRALMDAWAGYCESRAPEAKVLPMVKRGRR